MLRNLKDRLCLLSMSMPVVKIKRQIRLKLCRKLPSQSLKRELLSNEPS